MSSHTTTAAMLLSTDDCEIRKRILMGCTPHLYANREAGLQMRAWFNCAFQICYTTVSRHQHLLRIPLAASMPRRLPQREQWSIYTQGVCREFEVLPVVLYPRPNSMA